MALTAKKMDQKYTYGDYLTWHDNERWELIDGEAYNMTPAPMRKHQELLITLANIFFNFLKGKKCKLYTAPFDVRLPEGDEADEETTTVVRQIY